VGGQIELNIAVLRLPPLRPDRGKRSKNIAGDGGLLRLKDDRKRAVDFAGKNNGRWIEKKGPAVDGWKKNKLRGLGELQKPRRALQNFA